MGSIQEPNASLENLNDPDNPHLGAEQADIMSPLILKRAKASRSSGEWRDDDYDVLENGVVVAASSWSLLRPPVGNGGGRAATTATSSAHGTDTSRRARLRWRRLPRAGDGLKLGQSGGPLPETNH
jgi:hypothetical protein